MSGSWVAMLSVLLFGAVGKGVKSRGRLPSARPPGRFVLQCFAGQQPQVLADQAVDTFDLGGAEPPGLLDETLRGPDPLRRRMIERVEGIGDGVAACR